MRHHTWIGWTVAAAVAVTAYGSTARADDRIVRELNFYDLDQAFRTAVSHNPSDKPAQLANVNVGARSGTEISVQVLAAPPSPPRVLNVLSIDDPPFTADDYAVTGVVGYAGVDAADMDGVGYLELWSDFPGGGRFFTRTLADAGPLRMLAGHSANRSFRLPFHSNPGQRPTRISLNLVLPGRALVTLGELKLVQDEPVTQPATAAVSAGTAPAEFVSRLDLLRSEESRLIVQLAGAQQALSPKDAQVVVLQAELAKVRELIVRAGGTNETSPPWWARDRVTDTAAGLFGLAGFLALAEPLMRRGRGRPLVLSAVVAVGVLGQVYFGWAMAVLGRGEPPRAWAPLLLCAIAGWCVPASIPIVNRRYRDAELRRMRALDAVAV